MKLVLAEPESRRLAAAVAGWSEMVSSALAEVELRRAVLRATEGVLAGVRADQVEKLREQLSARADALLSRLGLLPIEERVLKSAAKLQPAALRSLDAIHLATALDLEELDTFVAYDPRLRAAAAAAGLEAVAP